MKPYRAAPQDGLAWVTGASSGIGRCVALELVRRGFRVVATARRADKLAALAQETHGMVLAAPGDMTDRGAMQALVARIEREHGPIALGFLNAGVFLPAERRGFDAATIWSTFEINTGGTVNCLDPLLAAMLARGCGQIAITASLAGYAGLPGSLAYGASKAALITMAETMRLTYAPRGLTVQIVNPGFVSTPIIAHEKRFAMPFLMEPEAAATRICDGLATGGFEIAFPRRLTWIFKAACLLPYPLFFRLMRATMATARR